ncbi:hypothetical protein RZS08_61085, partial [Arthrospira platensis SPKY1]|nr:hypothetical protein [Arthrospira platensis SPKY1]
LGLNTPGTAVWNRARVEGIIDFRDAVETAARYVPELISLGTDLVVVVAHTGLDGGSSYAGDLAAEENFGKRLAETVEGIDHIILGHHHRLIDGLKITGPDGRDVSLVMSG